RRVARRSRSVRAGTRYGRFQAGQGIEDRRADGPFRHRHRPHARRGAQRTQVMGKPGMKLGYQSELSSGVSKDMVKLMRIVAACFCAAVVLSQVTAQAPGKKGKDEPGQKQAKDYSNDPIVVKMMEFNKKKDGKLTKDEITDPRLMRLFDQADT